MFDITEEQLEAAYKREKAIRERPQNFRRKVNEFMRSKKTIPFAIILGVILAIVSPTESIADTFKSAVIALIIIFVILFVILLIPELRMVEQYRKMNGLTKRLDRECRMNALLHNSLRKYGYSAELLDKAKQRLDKIGWDKEESLVCLELLCDGHSDKCDFESTKKYLEAAKKITVSSSFSKRMIIGMELDFLVNTGNKSDYARVVEENESILYQDLSRNSSIACRLTDILSYYHYCKEDYCKALDTAMLGYNFRMKLHTEKAACNEEIQHSDDTALAETGLKIALYCIRLGMKEKAAFYYNSVKAYCSDSKLLSKSCESIRSLLKESEGVTDNG